MIKKIKSNLIFTISILFCAIVSVAIIYYIPALATEVKKTARQNIIKKLKEYENYSNKEFVIIGEYNKYRTYDKDYSYMEVDLIDKIALINEKYEYFPKSGKILAQKEESNIFCILNANIKKCYLGYTKNKDK